MSEAVVEAVLPTDVAAAVAGLHESLTLLLQYDTTGLEAAALLAVTVEVESARRRLSAVDHVLIAEIEARHLAAEHCATSTAALIGPLLRIAPAAAARRVKAAADLGPRRTLTGEPLPPLFDGVFTAQAAGVISAEHATIIVAAVNYLPDAVQAEYDRDVEATLLDWARQLDPTQLRRSAKQLVDALNPDGILSDDPYQQRIRDFSLTERSDSMVRLVATLTPITAAIWQPLLDSAARPVPAVDGTPDPRSPGQRNHDAFHDLGLMLLRADQLPSCNGVPVTVLVTMTADQLATGQGYATTGHGHLIPVPHVLNLAGDTQTVGVVVNHDGEVMSYGQAKRIVPPAMRLALIARDQGCTFPGCDRPPAWTEAHHFREFADGGPTSIDNCGLVCGYHHRTFQQQGWRSVMINAIPHFVPPKWLDPEQKPRRNTTHHTTLNPRC